MVTSVVLFLLLLLAVGGERLVELAVAERNMRWALERGGIESGQLHYRAMKVLHTGLLVGAAVEVVLADRPFVGWLGWPMLVLVALAQGLRWWCIATLGRQWNTRVVVVPGLSLVRRGPYRWMRHPNYVAVVVEGFALPLVHTAWVTALLFTVANAVVLRVRITCENRALAAESANAGSE